MTPLEHFLHLVRLGHYRGHSAGEGAACQLATAIHEHLPRLDGKARQGVYDFAALCVTKPSTAKELLEEASKP